MIRKKYNKVNVVTIFADYSGADRYWGDLMKVIGVFGGTGGSNDEIDEIATALGEVIGAEPSWIVLSGGDDPRGNGVKNKVLCKPNELSCVGWIGITKVGGVCSEKKPSGLVLRTTLGHRRNFLAACLVDAAIALPGEEGTVSELISTLCLGKPVLLLGCGWQDMKYWKNLSFAKSRESVDLSTLRTLIGLAECRLGRERNSQIGQLITENVIVENLLGVENRLRFVATIGEATVLLRQLVGIDPPVSLPDLADDSDIFLNDLFPTHAFPDLVDDDYRYKELERDFKDLVSPHSRDNS